MVAAIFPIPISNEKKITVLPADKRKATVVMDKADDDGKTQQMLGDEGTYKPLNKDLTLSLERRMNSCLLYLKKAGQLHPDAYTRLKSSAGRVLLLYGQPKLQKPSVPLQPIVSFVSSPTNELLKVPSNSACPSCGLHQLPRKELPRNPGVF